MARELHEHKMTDSDKEKYLGDYVQKSGNIQETITVFVHLCVCVLNFQYLQLCVFC